MSTEDLRCIVEGDKQGDYVKEEDDNIKITLRMSYAYKGRIYIQRQDITLIPQIKK